MFYVTEIIRKEDELEDQVLAPQTKQLRGVFHN